MNTMTIAVTVLLASTVVAAGIPSPEVQMAGAILAGPPELREGATVLGYSPQDDLVRLREGKNELNCLANDSSKNRFSVACYHRDLEPYMARGRELLGTGFDTSSGKVTEAYLRWVIYVPFATTETTGLSTKASDSVPWLMYPGTAGAHIMINPPKK
jgi:hypothetical protein